jgi:hypothetical protein
MRRSNAHAAQIAAISMKPRGPVGGCIATLAGPAR